MTPLITLPSCAKHAISQREKSVFLNGYVISNKNRSVSLLYYFMLYAPCTMRVY